MGRHLGEVGGRQRAVLGRTRAAGGPRRPRRSPPGERPPQRRGSATSASAWVTSAKRGRRRLPAAGVEGSDGGQAAGVRAPHAGGAGDPVRPAVVHRRARLPQVGRGRAGRAGGRLRRGHRLRRLGDRGLRPGVRERHDRQAGPGHVPGAAVEERRRRLGPDVLRHPHAGRLAVLGRPAVRAAPGAGQGEDMGFTFYTHPEIEFFLLKDQPEDGQEPRAGRQRRLLRPDQPRRRPRLPPDGRGRAGGARHLGRVQPPRGRAGPAGDRPAVRGRAHHRRQHHDVPARGEGGRDGQGCTRRSCRSRSPTSPAPACTRTCPCSRATATRSTTRPTSSTCPRPRAPSSPDCCGTRGRPPRSPTSGSTRTSGCSAARRRRWPRRRRTCAGGTRTGRRWSGCRCTSPARPTRPGSRCARPTRPATPTWPSR